MFTQRDLALIKHYLIGGAAIGGGLGLTTSLLNYFNTLKQQAAQPGLGKDTLTINLPAKKTGTEDDDEGQEKVALFGGSAAILAAGAGGLGSYVAVRQLYQALKRKQQKAELERAQQAYLGNLDDTMTEKTASWLAPEQGSSMKWPEVLANAPFSVAAVLGLASAVIANKGLHAAFPEVKEPLRRDPRRVVVRTVGVTRPEDMDGDHEKEAAAVDLDSGFEFALRTLLATASMSEKRASMTYLSDMVHATADGRLAELEAAAQYGPETMFELIKGASDAPIADPFYSMGITALTKSAMLRPTVLSLMSAEYQENYPTVCADARALDGDVQTTLLKLACEVGEGYRHAGCATLADAFKEVPDLEKSAGVFGALEFPMELYNMIMERKNLQNTNKLRDNSMSGKSQASDEEDKTQHPEIIAKDPSAKKFVAKEQDVIDKVLSEEARDGQPQA